MRTDLKDGASSGRESGKFLVASFANDLQQDLRLQRLLQISFDTFERMPRLGIAGNHHHRDVAEARILGAIPEELLTVDPRHRQLHPPATPSPRRTLFQ